VGDKEETDRCGVTCLVTGNNEKCVAESGHGGRHTWLRSVTDGRGRKPGDRVSSVEAFSAEREQFEGKQRPVKEDRESFNQFSQQFIDVFDKSDEDRILFNKAIQDFTEADVNQRKRTAIQMFQRWNALTELLVSELKHLREETRQKKRDEQEDL